MKKVLQHMLRVLSGQCEVKVMIKISQKEINLLEKCIVKHDLSQLSFINGENLYHLSNEHYNVLREIVCDELIAEGFINDKVTLYGIELENLIDILGKEL